MSSKAIEAAAKAMHDGPLGAGYEAEFDLTHGENSASSWCVEMAKAAIAAYEDALDRPKLEAAIFRCSETLDHLQRAVVSHDPYNELALRVQDARCDLYSTLPLPKEE